jgi:tryptophan 2,3-dioxygenase
VSETKGKSFGEEGGRLDYGSYLELETLLSAQHRRTDAHDELLFITVHQVYELWFKLLLFELSAARDAMLEGDIAMARHVFRRVRSIERLLVEQVDVLETMTPQDFMVFRSELEPASGFQSVQFREIEFLSGLKDPRYLDRVHTTEDERARLQRRLEEPSSGGATPRSPRCCSTEEAMDRSSSCRRTFSITTRRSRSGACAT